MTEIDELWKSIGELSKRTPLIFMDLLKNKPYTSYMDSEAGIKLWEKLFTEKARQEG